MAGYKGIEESSAAESQPSGGSAAAISHTVSLSCASAGAEASSRAYRHWPNSKGDWIAGGLEHDTRYQSFLKKMNLPE